jgi:hypothetical protein
MLRLLRMRGVFCVVIALGSAWALACGSEAPLEGPAAANRLESAALFASGAPAEQTSAASPSCSTRRAREVKFARDVEPILMSGCSGEFCHGLAMTSASRAHAFLVNQPSFECDGERPIVTPGDPDRSYLMDKVLGRNLCAGHAMPRGFGNRLSPDEVQTLSDWICEGAPND